ncbi:hypothetical protein [Actinomadura craniellae]|uniref:hypothetical protein n=1 Tax=Actinomadura craniellae TaxID=2231787 RepID=UPI0011BDC186|nr:hypothetical protein [Actinomadura craniellae]
MLFSEKFNIIKTVNDDWFDPILDNDTPLFVDPFLIFKEEGDRWRGAHDELIGHFDKCFHLIAEGNCNPRSVPYKKALALLTFPEPREFCLGYTESGTEGAGGGRGYARLIAEAMEAAIGRGLTDLRHFEELGILNEGIGPDRISDVTCNILRRHFIDYTKRVACRYDIPTERMKIPGASFDTVRINWQTEWHELPRNPINGKPILLTPEHFLRDLPVLNADDWWEYYEAEQLRNDLNYEVMGRVDKKSIVWVARRNPELVREWAQDREGQPAAPYDLRRDPRGIYQWDEATRSYVERHPLIIQPPQSEGEFFSIIELVIREFKNYIEEQRGWSLLWNDGHKKDKPEEAVQLVFLGIARSYCRANNIVVDREVELGRGPVDFKFSNGYNQRALLEIKKLHNGRFWNGIEAQLPSYLKSDECVHGWFVSVQYRSNKAALKRLEELPEIVACTAMRTRKNLRLRHIDATPKRSASNLERPQEG